MKGCEDALNDDCSEKPVLMGGVNTVEKPREDEGISRFDADTFIV